MGHDVAGSGGHDGVGHAGGAGNWSYRMNTTSTKLGVTFMACLVSKAVIRCVTLLLLASISPCLLMAACVTYRPVVTRPATLGEELMSLESARKDGLLTDEEFSKRRAETIATWKAIGDTPIIEPSRQNSPRETGAPK